MLGMVVGGDRQRHTFFRFASLRQYPPLKGRICMLVPIAALAMQLQALHMQQQCRQHCDTVKEYPRCIILNKPSSVVSCTNCARRSHTYASSYGLMQRRESDGSTNLSDITMVEGANNEPSRHKLSRQRFKGHGVRKHGRWQDARQASTRSWLLLKSSTHKRFTGSGHARDTSTRTLPRHCSLASAGNKCHNHCLMRSAHLNASPVGESNTSASSDNSYAAWIASSNCTPVFESTAHSEPALAPT